MDKMPGVYQSLGKEIAMNPTTEKILGMLELMWQAADEDAKTMINEDHFDQVDVDRAIARQETIADVIDAIKNLTGGDRG